jgi:uncharacterized phiE125 gp8 family phage protein
MIVITNQIVETVAPVVEPVTLTEAKAHCRIDSTDSDTILATMITAARQWCETYCQRSLVQRTYRADVPYFASVYDLPMKPLASLSSVKYYNSDSPQALTELDSTYYNADTGRGMIYLDADSGNLPSHAVRHDAVQITFVAGYAPGTGSPIDHAENVPAAIKAAILLQVGDLFENRERSTQLNIKELPTVNMLLAPYRYY